MDLNFESTFTDGAWHVKVSGEIDIYNSDEMKNYIAKLLEENMVDVHLDCEKLSYIDSTGLGALVGVLKKLKAENKTMHLLKLKSNILKLLSITKLDEIFLIDGGSGDE